MIQYVRDRKGVKEQRFNEARLTAPEIDIQGKKAALLRKLNRIEDRLSDQSSQVVAGSMQLLDASGCPNDQLIISLSGIDMLKLRKSCDQYLIETSQVRIVLAMLVALTAAPAFAAWEKMVSNGDITIYIDPQSIKINGGNRSILAMVAYNEVLPNGARSIRGMMEYDCKGSRFRTLSFSHYAEPLAQGKLLSGNDVPSNWSSVAPDTFAAEALAHVCRK